MKNVFEVEDLYGFGLWLLVVIVSVGWFWKKGVGINF